MSFDSVLAGRAGTRLEWEQLPLDVRRSIEEHLGAEVLSARTQHLGFSPALASRLTLSNGRRVFVKAIGPDEESGAPGGQDSYRREARITAELPPRMPAPRLVESFEVAGWVMLALEDLEGSNPVVPWQKHELRRVLDALAELAESGTPSPLALPPAGTPGGSAHWRDLASSPQRLARLPGLDPWVTARLEHLVAWEGTADEASGGPTLLHCDIRSDNIVLTDRRVYFVDWPHSRIGQPWLDLLYILPSVAMQGGPAPQELFWSHPTARQADPVAVRAVLTGFAGFMIDGATQPPPPGLPTLRQFQLAQGREAIAWLKTML